MTFADETSLQSLPEIETLAWIAQRLETEIRLHGSVAAALLQGSGKSNFPPSSLFDLVPPLSDIDIVLKSQDLVSQVQAAIMQHLPVGRFFHWEIRILEQLTGYNKYAHIQLQGQPAVVFTTDHDHDYAAQLRDCPKAVISLDPDGHLRISFTGDPSTSPPRVKWLGENTALGESGINGALRDVLYVARVLKSNVQETAPLQLLKRNLQSFGGVGVAQALRRSTGELYRTQFALLKYLLTRAASPLARRELSIPWSLPRRRFLARVPFGNWRPILQGTCTDGAPP